MRCNPDLAKYGLEYIEYGADMRRHLKPPPKSEPPYPIDDGIFKELASKKFIQLHKQKRIIGPLNPDEVPDGTFISPVFVKEKDLSRNKVLVLIDYSSPKAESINSEIPDYEAWVEFPSIIFFLQIILTFGPSSWIWVADLQDAYYNVWIKRDYTNLFGIQWLGKILLPFFMPFGIATGCTTLQKLLDIVVQALEQVFPQIFCFKSSAITDHYLDDQCGVAPSLSIAWLQCTLYITIVSLIGLPFSPSKIQFPSKFAILLGFELNLVTFTLSLKKKKAKTYLKQVNSLLSDPDSATIKIMQQITGRLRHAARAIHGATAFVRRLEKQTNKLLASGHFKHAPFSLDKEARHDLLFWQILLPNFNGIPFSFIVKRKCDISITLFTDASGAPHKGFGAWDTLGQCFSIPWSNTLLKNSKLLLGNHINVLELITFCVAILSSKKLYKNKAIQLFCDNETACTWWINKAPKFSIRYYNLVAHLIRMTTLHCILNRIFVWVDYINTNNNLRADALSKLNKKALFIPQENFGFINFHTINPTKILNKFVKVWRSKGWL